MKIPATLLSSLAKVECLKEGGFVGALDPGYVPVRAFGVSSRGAPSAKKVVASTASRRFLMA